jgi:hypothetical protein
VPKYPGIEYCHKNGLTELQYKPPEEIPLPPALDKQSSACRAPFFRYSSILPDADPLTF